MYAKEFDFNGHEENKNLISLFLYAGPTESCTADVYARHLWEPYWYWRWHNSRDWVEPIPTCTGSLLYTGDGYLDTDARFASMRAFLGPHRVKSLAALQVMHHGARANWHTGLADKIRPELSVFSSNPLHRGYRHPHTEVLEDFAPYRPLQASKGESVNFAFELLLP
ncbi:hypothetical protein D3C85_1394890 [compost metagenome]